MNSTTHPDTTSSQPGMSGRRVTLIVLLLLIVIGVILSYTLWSYGQLGAIRKHKQAAWAELREPLADRYRVLEKIVAAGVDDTSIPMAWGEKFRLAVDSFRTTAQVTYQYDAAIEVEKLLAEAEFAFPAAAQDSSLTEAVERFNAQLDRETQQLTTPGCQLLDVFLEFPPPGQFKLASSIPAA